MGRPPIRSPALEFGDSAAVILRANIANFHAGRRTHGATRSSTAGYAAAEYAEHARPGGGAEGMRANAARKSDAASDAAPEPYRDAPSENSFLPGLNPEPVFVDHRIA